MIFMTCHMLFYYFSLGASFLPNESHFAMSQCHFFAMSQSKFFSMSRCNFFAMSRNHLFAMSRSHLFAMSQSEFFSMSQCNLFAMFRSHYFAMSQSHVSRGLKVTFRKVSKSLSQVSKSLFREVLKLLFHEVGGYRVEIYHPSGYWPFTWLGLVRSH